MSLQRAIKFVQTGSGKLLTHAEVSAALKEIDALGLKVGEVPEQLTTSKMILEEFGSVFRDAEPGVILLRMLDQSEKDWLDRARDAGLTV